MADKGTELSIIIRTVDKATAGIKAVNKRLDELTRPTREFGKALSELGEKSGFNALRDGFKGVRTAVRDAIGTVAVIGGTIGVAVAGVLSLVDHFDKLGDTAERLGTSADFLAGIRYAAERAGAPLEAVDGSLQALVTNMGAAKAGTGKMLKFLNQVSPALARQVTSAHSLEEALGLIAGATAKLPDAARRSKLIAATLGDPALAPLLARGSAGIQELLTRYHELAGGQGDASEAAGKVDDSLKDMHAAAEGVKAALVTGLSPALRAIIDQLKDWLVAHRDDVARWAQDIGEKLPGAVDHVVSAVRGAVDQVSGFVDAIGGWKVAAGALAVVMAGPLIESVVALGAALLTTPLGVVVTGLAAIAAGITAITHETKEFKSFADALADQKAHPPTGPTHEEEVQEMMRSGRDAARRQALAAATGKTLDQISYEMTTRSTEDMNRDFERARVVMSLRNGALGTLASAFAAPSSSATTTAQDGPLPPVPFRVGPAQEVKIKVDIANAPRGTTAKVETKGGASVDLTTGHQMGYP